jgi:hypothetical protein
MSHRGLLVFSWLSLIGIFLILLFFGIEVIYMQYKYEVIVKSSKAELEALVAHYLNSGWVCDGGVNISMFSPYEISYAQAVQKVVSGSKEIDQ